MSYKDEVHIPQEDDIILFTGEHYMQTQRQKTSNSGSNYDLIA